MNRDGPKTLLIMCSGLGMGNSTRLLGVVQALRSEAAASAANLRIVVGTSGRAVPFWIAEGKALAVEVLRLESCAPSLGHSAARIPWLSLVGASAAKAYLVNSYRVFSFLRARKIDLALIDSDYHCLPLLLFGVPIFALGQAWDVLRRAGLSTRPADPDRFHILIEKLDYLFQRLVSRRILAPCFDPAAPPAGAVRPIPLIVRREFEAPAGEQAHGPMTVLLGGSGIGSAPLLAYAREHGLSVIGGRPDAVSALDEAGRPLIDRASAVIVQGGLSSISECIARRKAAVVVPIERHAEQASNALTVERLGLGFCAPELRDAPDALLRRLRDMTSRSAPRWPATDGAGIAAAELLRRIGLSPQNGLNSGSAAPSPEA